MLKFLIASIIVTLYASINNINILITKKSVLINLKFLFAKNFDKLLLFVKTFKRLLKSKQFLQQQQH